MEIRTINVRQRVRSRNCVRQSPKWCVCVISVCRISLVTYMRNTQLVLVLLVVLNAPLASSIQNETALKEKQLFASEPARKSLCRDFSEGLCRLYITTSLDSDFLAPRKGAFALFYNE